ncbi:hypothetical protein C5167_029676, partial [Papaver somniferum]
MILPPSLSLKQSFKKRHRYSEGYCRKNRSYDPQFHPFQSCGTFDFGRDQVSRIPWQKYCYLNCLAKTGGVSR